MTVTLTRALDKGSGKGGADLLGGDPQTSQASLENSDESFPAPAPWSRRAHHKDVAGWLMRS